MSRRSPCPLACTLDIVGDKWTLLVIRDLWAGKSSFNEFAASPEGIATNILAERLDRLRAHGLVERERSPTHRGRYVYRLTESGRALEPAMQAIADWGLTHLPGTGIRVQPSA